jgi:hypothetical protein
MRSLEILDTGDCFSIGGIVGELTKGERLANYDKLSKEAIRKSKAAIKV